MDVVLTKLPSRVIFVCDRDMLMIDKDKFKELVIRDTGRTIGEVFEEVFGERGVQSEYCNKLSVQLINLFEMVG